MPLSIVIFGNTNNGPLLLAQGLRELGHDVRLILNRKEALHRPESRYPDWHGAYPDWIVDCATMTDKDIVYQTSAMREAVHHLTNDIDLVILNDTGPAFAGYLNSPHIVFLTGSDLAYYASFEMMQICSAQWDSDFKRSPQGRSEIMKLTDLVARQRDGILGAELVCYPRRGLIPSGDMLLDEIGVLDCRRFMLYMANLVDLKPQKVTNNDRLVVLNGSRVVFRPDLNPQLGAIDFKGTEILLEGFARYVKAGGSGELRMVKKGQDVGVAQALIEELGIQGYIKWLDEMSLAQFYQEMTAADLVCDQFGSSIPGGVTLDAYALARPVLANFRNDIFSQRFPEPLPGFDARTSVEVANHLLAIEQNRSCLAEMGLRCRAYAERFLSPQMMAAELISNINNCASSGSSFQARAIKATGKRWLNRLSFWR